jgi:outer membrane protein
MTKILAIAACICFCIQTGSAQAQEIKVGTVILDRVLRESAPAKAAQIELNTEFSQRQKDLQDMAQVLKDKSDAFDKDREQLSAEDRAQRRLAMSLLDIDFQRKQREYNEDLQRRHDEEVADILDRANKVIAQIAEQQHYDLILNEEAYRYSQIDITDQVLNALAASSTSDNAGTAGAN